MLEFSQVIEIFLTFILDFIYIVIRFMDISWIKTISWEFYLLS